MAVASATERLAMMREACGNDKRATAAVMRYGY
jgi:hypothetical protein